MNEGKFFNIKTQKNLLVSKHTNFFFLQELPPTNDILRELFVTIFVKCREERDSAVGYHYEIYCILFI